MTNGSFEVESAEDPTIPAGWFPFFSKNKTIEISQSAQKSGKNSVKLSVQKVPGGHLGIAQIIPVDDGKIYTFTVHLMNNTADPLTQGTSGMIGIEWKDSNGKEISRTTSNEWDMSLSRMRWEPYSISEKAPRGAKTAAMVISFYDGDRGGSGSCFVDEARVDMKK